MKKIIEHVKLELETTLSDIENLLIAKLKSITISFNTNDLTEKYFNEKLLPLIKEETNVIYVFKLKSDFDLTYHLKNNKIKDKSIKFPQINHKSNTKVLYIGSVQNNFKNRIKQHLGFGSKSTYSLKLCKWAKKEKLEIVIEYFILKNIHSKITLRLIENMLANSLKPQFGKYDKNKTK